MKRRNAIRNRNQAAQIIQRAYRRHALLCRLKQQNTEALTVVALESEVRKNLFQLEARMQKRVARIEAATTSWGLPNPSSALPLDPLEILATPTFFDWEERCIKRIQRWWRRILRSRSIQEAAGKSRSRPSRIPPFAFSREQQRAWRDQFTQKFPDLPPDSLLTDDLDPMPFPQPSPFETSQSLLDPHPTFGPADWQELRALRRLFRAQARIEEKTLTDHDRLSVPVDGSPRSLLPYQREVLSEYEGMKRLIEVEQRADIPRRLWSAMQTAGSCHIQLEMCRHILSQASSIRPEDL